MNTFNPYTMDLVEQRHRGRLAAAERHRRRSEAKERRRAERTSHDRLRWWGALAAPARSA